MKNYILFFFMLLTTSFSFGQKVFSVNYESRADLKVFVVDYESRTDLKIFFVNYESRAGWVNKSKKHLMY